MTPRFKVVITDLALASIENEENVLREVGASVTVARSVQREELLKDIRDADALLVQWAPIDAAILAELTRCRVIVRYGIGVDNVDLAAAKARGIAVCNVPDYGIDEVADHALSLAVALGRQLPQVDRRVRSGVWKQGPVAPMPAFRDMVFATAGLGRIARAVLERARGLKFKLAAYDPYVPAEVFAKLGVARLELERLFSEADVLSLHLPLTAETRHFINADRLARMKTTAIVINTARGPLVDTAALCSALQAGRIAGAGLDVFEAEPLPADSPARASPNTLLTSHIAWYSERSVPTLQRKAAEETARGLLGQPLLNRVN